MDYAIHLDAGAAALSQFSSWGQSALVSEAHPPVYRDWTQAIPARKNDAPVSDAAPNHVVSITSVDPALGTAATSAKAQHRNEADSFAVQSVGALEKVARQRTRILAARYSQSGQNTTEIEARLQILTAKLEGYSPRVSESQVAQLEQAAAMVDHVSLKREERARRLAALIAG